MHQIRVQLEFLGVEVSDEYAASWNLSPKVSTHAQVRIHQCRSQQRWNTIIAQQAGFCVGFFKISSRLAVWTKSYEQDQDPFKAAALILKKIAERDHHLIIFSNNKILKDTLINPSKGIGNADFRLGT